MPCAVRGIYLDRMIGFPRRVNRLILAVKNYESYGLALVNGMPSDGVDCVASLKGAAPLKIRHVK